MTVTLSVMQRLLSDLQGLLRTLAHDLDKRINQFTMCIHCGAKQRCRFVWLEFCYSRLKARFANSVVADWKRPQERVGNAANDIMNARLRARSAGGSPFKSFTVHATSMEVSSACAPPSIHHRLSHMAIANKSIAPGA